IALVFGQCLVLRDLSFSGERSDHVVIHTRLDCCDSDWHVQDVEIVVRSAELQRYQVQLFKIPSLEPFRRLLSGIDPGEIRSCRFAILLEPAEHPTFHLQPQLVRIQWHSCTSSRSKRYPSSHFSKLDYSATPWRGVTVVLKTASDKVL